MFFILLKCFLSPSHVQCTVQEMPELGGGLGNIMACNCPILQYSPAVQGGEVTCTKSPSWLEVGLEADIAPQSTVSFLSLARPQHPASS